MKTELDRLLEDHQCFHSDFQIDRFILALSGGTEYGCYKQAMRELNKRWRGLRSLLQDQALKDVDLDEKHEMLGKVDIGTFAGRRLRIEIAALELSLEEIEKRIEDTAREFGRFAGQVRYFKHKLGPLTPEKREKLDAEMWDHKLKLMAALDLMAYGKLSRETIEHIHVAPIARDDLKKWLPHANGDEKSQAKKDALVEWFTDLKTVIVPEHDSLPYGEVLALMEGSDG